MLFLGYNPEMKRWFREKDEELDFSAQARVHGQKVSKQQEEDKFFALHDSTLNSVFFDNAGNFVGIDFLDLTYGYHKEQTAPIQHDTFFEVNPDVYKDANDHTRLVGFRTTKNCKDSMLIRSLQPIYFSVNQEMCQEHLIALTDNMIHEVEAYGPSVCPVNYNVNSYTPEARAGTPTNTSDNHNLLSLVVVFLVIVIMIQLVICAYLKRLSNARSAEKRDENMRNQLQENGPSEIAPKVTADSESPPQSREATR